MIKSNLFLVILMLLYVLAASSQKLIFSEKGEIGTKGTNWSLSGTHPVLIHVKGDAHISSRLLENLYDQGFNVKIISDGDIIFKNAATFNNNKPSSFSVNARNGIEFWANASILSNAPLNIELFAEKSIVVHPKTVLKSNGGDIRIQAFNTNQKFNKNPESSLTIEGIVDASSSDIGGKIITTADEVQISSKASIRSNGTYGGGKILIGGDWQGGAAPEMRENEYIYEAMAVKVEKGAVIDASATLNGHGGKVVVWSNINHPLSNTFVQGDLLAMGGKLSGKGGKIETSGGAIDFGSISVSTLAADGSAGEWLLDPWNFFFNSTQLDNLASNLASTNVTISTAGSTASGTPTTFFGRGHIVFEGNFTYTSGNINRTLTLTSNKDIWIKGNISSTGGSLNVTFDAPSNQNLYINGDITTNGGAVTVNNGSQIHLQKTSGTQTINTNGGWILFGNSNIRLLRHDGSLVLNSGSGNIDWNNSGSVEQINTFTDITDNQRMGWGGRHCDSEKSYTWGTNESIVSGREYTIRFRLWGDFPSPSNSDIRVNGEVYFRVLKSGSTLSDYWTPNGSQYNEINSATIDVTFLASHTGNLQTVTGVSCIAWDPAVEIEWVRETAFPTTNYSSGSRSLQLITTSGLISTGLKPFTGLAALTVNTNENSSSRIDGVISGTTNFTKSGTGTIRLAGNNTFTGTTTISAGTLQVGINGTTGSLGTGAVTNNASLLLDRTDNYTITNAISGTGTLTKQRNGTTTLTGNNTYTGTTIISAGTIQVGNNGTAGSVGTGNIVNNATFTINRSNNVTIVNTISGSGIVNKLNNTTATFTGNNSYTGATNITGTLVIQNNAPTSNSTTYQGSGQLRIESVGSAFAAAFSTSGWTFGSTLTSLTIGASTNTANITLGATTIAGPIRVYGGDITISGALTATGDDINLHATGNVTQSAALTANGLGLHGTGTFTLTNTSNNVTTIAGGDNTTKLGRVSYVDASGGLTIGSVNPTGITSTGPILIETLSRDITVSNSVATEDMSSDAIIINAGKSSAIGTSAGGDIKISGSPTVMTGVGGIAKLFSGSEPASTGLTTLAGGSANVQYLTDETTLSFNPALQGNNVYALYRVANKPDAPTNLVATPGVGQIAISYTAGADNGSPIANYEYTLDGTNWTAFSPAVTGTSVTVTSLTNGTQYTILLRAVNIAGAGASSAPVTATTSSVPPDAPTNLVATPCGSQVSISFTSGADGGSPITNYQYSLDGTNWTTFSPAVTGTTVTITTLSNGTYNIKLRAVNSVGSGAASASVTSTIDNTVSIAYTGATISTATNKSAQVTLSATVTLPAGANASQQAQLRFIDRGTGQPISGWLAVTGTSNTGTVSHTAALTLGTHEIYRKYNIGFEVGGSGCFTRNNPSDDVAITVAEPSCGCY